MLTVYKIDVQQGNALEAETVEKVKLGMSKEQVRFLLGNPIITDSFHPQRWDYIYLFIPGYGEQQRRQLTLIFDRDEVIDIFKHNIASDNTAAAKNNENNKGEKKNSDSEKVATDKEAEKEQQVREKQAENLEEVIETNQDPSN